MELIPLNLREAAQLYDILGKHLPDNQDMSVLDMLIYIINSMQNTDDYIRSLELMLKINVEELQEIYKPLEIVEMFKDALFVNRAFDLKRLLTL